MTKQKRMIYIYEENLDYYDALENKSDFINRALAKGKSQEPVKDPDDINYIQRKIAEIDRARKAEAERRRASSS